MDGQEQPRRRPGGPGRPGPAQPTWPRGANGASTTAPTRQRQKARASAGMAATRIRIGEVEMARIPTVIQRRTCFWTRPQAPASRNRSRTAATNRSAAARSAAAAGTGAWPSWAATAASTRAAAPAGLRVVGEAEAGPAAALDLGPEDVVLQVAPGPAGGQDPVGEGPVADRPAKLGRGPLQQPAPRRLGEHLDRVGPGHGDARPAADGEVEQQVGVGGGRAAEVRLGRRPGAHVELERRPSRRVGGDRRGDQAELQPGGGRAAKAGMVEAGGDLPLGPPLQRPGDHAEQVDVAALGRPAAERARAVQVDPTRAGPSTLVSPAVTAAG